MYKTLVKPFFDVVMALMAIVILFPVFLIIALTLGIHLRSSPFFTQKRPGKKECIFTIFKFKTMKDSCDVNGNLLPDSERLTRIGKLIRACSLDEIPQLFNILKGDMSWVGPRPLLPQYVPLYNQFQKQRHATKPGITGWAQVNGRNTLNWEQKFEYDVYYVNNCTFKLDVIILFKTVKKVFIREGINASTTITTKPFTGTKE